jgi:sulfide:quinone oxidoreductase
MNEIVILGGGVAGVLVADTLARRLPPDLSNITVVSESENHYFQTAQIQVAFDQVSPGTLKRPVRGLLNKRVELLRQKVVAVDHEDQWVTLESGKDLHYDYLVIATGCSLEPAMVPGLEEAGHHFFSLGEAMVLRSRLKRFEGGRIVVGAASVPHKNPLGPVEFAFLLEEELKRRDLKQSSEIVFVHPEAQPHKNNEVSRLILDLFRQRGIKFKPRFHTRSADPEACVISNRRGATVEYDLLVMAPPNRGAKFLRRSPLADRRGFIRTLPRSLQVKDAESVWAVGDATNLAVSKEASTAHFEARAVAEQIEASVLETIPDRKKAEYRGRVISFLETGYDEAIMLDYTRKSAPEVAPPSEAICLLKRGFMKSYWRLLTQSVV